MKKLLTLICALFCMAQVCSANPVKQWGQLQVKGAQLCDQSGNPVVLRGVSLDGTTSSLGSTTKMR